MLFVALYLVKELLMPNVKFVLKEPNIKEPTLVYLLFSYSNNRFKYSTGIKIHPDFWNPNEQKARDTRKFTHAAEINTRLKNMSTCVENEYRRLINDKITPNNDRLRLKLDELLLKREIKNEKDFILFIENYIKTTNKRLNTIKQYNTALSRIKDYKEFTRKGLLFEDIDLNFYEDFTAYLTNHKNYGINTIGTIFKNIKVFMSEAVERGLTTNNQFRSKKFKKTAETSESIYLSTNEIDQLYKLDLSNNPRLDRVRDLFIVGCYTGLRFSDLSQIKGENLIDNKTKLKITTQKTDQIVIIPLHRYIKEIIKKYDGVPPTALSNQKMNEYLKEMAEKANLITEVVLTFTKGGQKVTETNKKYELVTVHTARRSFATNAYLNDVPSISIMKITGHKTEKAFLTYIKISQEDNANKLLNHPFFK